MKTTARFNQPRGSSLPLDLHGVADLLACMAQALKQMQFYGVGSPGGQRALDAARLVFEDVWAETDRLQCTVGANSFEVEGTVVYESDGLSESLPFLFYKDGIRELIFLPGFEGPELEAFLATLGRARSVRSDDDDLVTLLWHQDLAYLRYGYVDVTADTGDRGGRETGGGSASHGKDDGSRPPSDLVVRRDVEPRTDADLGPRNQWEDPAALPGPRSAAEAPPSAAMQLLEPDEMAAIQREIEREAQRDVERDVVSALLDSLEDAPAAKQAEILTVLEGLLPALLSTRFELVAAALSDLRRWAASHASTDHTGAIAAIATGPGMQAAVDAVLAAIQSGESLPRASAVESLFAELGPVCFAQLVRTSEAVKNKDIRDALQGVVERGVRAHREVAYAALEASDAVVLRALLQQLQRAPDPGDARRVVKLLHHDDAAVREAAVRVVVAGGGRDAVQTLRRAMADPSSEVRVAALWGLGAWRAAEVRADLELRLNDKSLVDVPGVEKMALFDAYARVAGDGAVPLLGRILLGRSGWGRRWPPELRVCAARVLSLVGTAATELLEKAARDDEDGVRRAAQRALQRLEST